MLVRPTNRTFLICRRRTFLICFDIRKQYYLTAKEEVSQGVSLDLTSGFSYASHERAAINEEGSYYVAQVLENFCEVHPIFNEIFRQGNYHPLSLATSSENAKFNPEYEGE